MNTKKELIILTIIPLFIIGCNTTFLNHKDYELKLTDLKWNIECEGVGEIYLKSQNFIYGHNYDSTYVIISPENGKLIGTLNPYTVEKERVCLILDNIREFKNDYSLYNVNADKQKYSKVTLKVFDRQYRGDTETFYLIVNTLQNKEITLLFNREEFHFISDIQYYKDGKFIMIYNGEAENEAHKYYTYVGLFDVDKLIN
jgi:hypothetical protein